MSTQSADKNLSRRDFLRQGSYTAAGVAGLAALAAPAILRGQNLDRRINLGVIGTGSRGCNVLRMIAEHEGYLVTDVCDIYPPNLEEGKKSSGNEKVRAHTKWEKVLEQQDVEAVMIATPPHLHAELAVAALAAGKHVFCEKSLCLNMKEINRIGRAVDSTDKVFLVSYEYRLTECIAQARTLVEKGLLGRVTQFFVHWDVNKTWRREAAPEWEQVLNWRLYEKYSGGVLTELLSHKIDQVLDILGTMPVQASCFGKVRTYKDGRESPDSVVGIFEMDDEVLGIASSQLTNSRRGRGWVLYGTHGTIEYDVDELRIYWEKNTRHFDSKEIKHEFAKVKLGQSLAESEKGAEKPGKVIKYDITNTTATIQALDHFYDCVRRGAKPILDYASVRRTTIATMMLVQSSRRGGRVFTRKEFEAMG